MRNYFKSLKRNAGFTLIELLVVIGILGVLAAALIATIDPFEQLKKAQDSNVKNTAVEFVTANIRYYTTHNVLPWANPAVTSCGVAGASPTNGSISALNLTNALANGCLTALITDGELKSGFTTVTTILKSIVVSGTTNGVTACFDPQSRSQDRDPNTKYAANGTPTTGCVAQTAGNTSATLCYWCGQ